MSVVGYDDRTGTMLAAPSLQTAAVATPRPWAFSSGFIVSPRYDLLFFICSPVLAWLLGASISHTDAPNRSINVGAYSNSFANFFIGTFIMAHLFAVFFRSHGNQNIFKLHPVRFAVVPVALFAAMTLSQTVAVFISVLATWWDVYHSSMQTFGLGRIYDMRQGNDPAIGRTLDRWLNLLLYAGPILAGATLMDHVDDFEEFEEIGSVFFTSIPAYMKSNQRYLTWAVLALGLPFLAYYVWAYWQLHRRGYAVSMQKVGLLVSTGLVSIQTWGFNTFGEAFFIMNFFHALQYFALVWWSEKKNLMRVIRVENRRWGKPLVLAVFLLVAFGYGLWAETTDPDSHVLFNLVIVVAILHFWYDGFIWSVRKRQV